MKKFLLVALVALVAAGCAMGPGYNPGLGGWAFRTSRGVFLQITHTCTDYGRLYQSGYGLVKEVVGATPQGVQLDPVGYDYQVEVTFQSLNKEGQVVGTYAATFWVSQYTGTAQWIISNRSTGGGGIQSHCLR